MEKKDNKVLLYILLMLAFISIGALFYIIGKNVGLLTNNSSESNQIINSNSNSTDIDSNVVNDDSESIKTNDNDNDNITTLENYNINQIYNIVLHKAYIEDGDPVYINKTITDKAIIDKILSKIDDAKYLEIMPSVGLGGNDWLEVS